MKPVFVTAVALLAIVPLVTPHPAHAELQSCQTSIGGDLVQFKYDADNPELGDGPGLKARIFGNRGEVTCPGLVTLRALTPELDDAGRAPFCLQWDKKDETYLGYAQGERDGFGHCVTPSRSFCERVNGSAKAAVQMTNNADGFANDVAGNVVGDKFGSIVVKTTGQKLFDRMQDAGLAALAASSPAGLAAVAVTAVAVGGAVYVCSDDGAQGADMEGQTNRLPEGATVDDGADLLGADLPRNTDPEAVTPPVSQDVIEKPLADPAPPPQADQQTVPQDRTPQGPAPETDIPAAKAAPSATDPDPAPQSPPAAEN
ncbi:hypothetical protein ERN12_04950 [Rhodobacteraceae bacterium]|nr:hypothetical protein ERN12_04950 [Paracoccaceae bacterium]